jgi:hypothetical protein
MRARTDLWEPRGGNAPRSPGPMQVSMQCFVARVDVIAARSLGKEEVM